MMPDKIYCWSGVLGSFYASPQKPAVKTEEYIRKDALLEWAKVYKEEADALARGRTDNLSWGESVAMKNLIVEINSL